MLPGILCNLTISSIYNWANLAIDILRFIAKKWALLVNWSTTTQIASWPLKVHGKWVTKSIAMLSHFHTGISKGCSVPPGLWCSSITFWQVKQVDTNCATSFFISCHQKVSLRSWYILVMSGCKLRRLLCPSSRINLFTLVSSGTQTLPLNLKTPSSPKTNSLTWFDPDNSFTFCKLASTDYLSLIKLKKSLDLVRVLHLMNSGSNSTCSLISLNLSSNSNSLIMRCATCTVFLLKASATTFAFPGWYRSLKS